MFDALKAWIGKGRAWIFRQPAVRYRPPDTRAPTGAPPGAAPPPAHDAVGVPGAPGAPPPASSGYRGAYSSTAGSTRRQLPDPKIPRQPDYVLGRADAVNEYVTGGGTNMYLGQYLRVL